MRTKTRQKREREKKTPKREKENLSCSSFFWNGTVRLLDVLWMKTICLSRVKGLWKAEDKIRTRFKKSSNGWRLRLCCASRLSSVYVNLTLLTWHRSESYLKKKLVNDKTHSTKSKLEHSFFNRNFSTCFASLLFYLAWSKLQKKTVLLCTF